MLCHILISHSRRAWTRVAQPQPTISTRLGKSWMVMGHDQGHVLNVELQLLPQLGPYTTCRRLTEANSCPSPHTNP